MHPVEIARLDDDRQLVGRSHAATACADRSRMVGCSPQSGHSGSRFTFTLRKVVDSASYISSEPDSESPTPISSFSTSVAWSVPSAPATAPNTPASEQAVIIPGGGGSRKMQG